MKRFFYRVFCGFFLGIGLLGPGISGSVLAIIMGVYDRLLEIIANPFKNIKKNFFYLMPMGIGAVVSVVAFALAFNYLFTTYKRETYLLIFGLILGNLPVIFKKAASGRFKKRYIISAVVACAIAILIGLFQYSLPTDQGAAFALPDFYYLALCGLAAGAACMVPGLCCSLVLITMGVFEYLMRTAHDMLDGISPRELLVTGIVVGCFVVALVLSSKVIRRIFIRYPGVAYWAVFGFMIGSLVDIGITIGLPQEGSFWLVDGTMFLVGLGISLLFVLLGRRYAVMEEHLLPEKQK